MLQNNSVRQLEDQYKDRLGPLANEVSQNDDESRPIRADLYRNGIFEPTPERYGLPVMSMSQLLLPRSGLDFLYAVPSLSLAQTFELHEYAGSSENRFIIRTDRKEAIYTATESSTARDRMLCGSSRPFTMHILDKIHKETLTFQRKWAIGALCCKGQCLEVWAPPGDLIGQIRETFSIFRSEFIIEDATGDTVYKFTGFPRYMWNSFLPSESEFSIVSATDDTVKGTIRRSWQTDTCIYTQVIQFNDRDMDVKHKALFLAASILLEYVYYQSKRLS